MKHQLRQTLNTVLALRVQDHDLVGLLDAIASACWSIAREVRTSAIDGNLGATDSVNVQGEDQKPLDILANDLFMQAIRPCASVAAALSEEVEEITWFKQPKQGDFLVSFDPLDGSSNLDVNLSVGTIFSISRVKADGDRNVLHSGHDVICAGYAIYGPSTMLVLTFGQGVDGFTLDLDADTFVLTHPNMRIATESAEFAVNMSRMRHWHPPIIQYIEDCMAGPDGPRAKAFNMRWTASMVADVHRILTRGGVFLYPADTDNESQGGKLRLMYEAIPMAVIAQAAGGSATDGATPILDLVPSGPHQRISVILGSADEVAHVAAAYA